MVEPMMPQLPLRRRKEMRWARIASGREVRGTSPRDPDNLTTPPGGSRRGPPRSLLPTGWRGRSGPARP